MVLNLIILNGCFMISKGFPVPFFNKTFSPVICWLDEAVCLHNINHALSKYLSPVCKFQTCPSAPSTTQIHFYLSCCASFVHTFIFILALSVIHLLLPLTVLSYLHTFIPTHIHTSMPVPTYMKTRTPTLPLVGFISILFLSLNSIYLHILCYP